jgi:hypothetical protein
MSARASESPKPAIGVALTGEPVVSDKTHWLSAENEVMARLVDR